MKGLGRPSDCRLRIGPRLASSRDLNCNFITYLLPMENHSSNPEDVSVSPAFITALARGGILASNCEANSGSLGRYILSPQEDRFQIVRGHSIIWITGDSEEDKVLVSQLQSTVLQGLTHQVIDLNKHSAIEQYKVRLITSQWTETS